MKKIQLLAAAAVAFAALWACQSKDEPVKPQEKATVSVSPTSVAFEADGGTLRVAVTTNQDAYTVTGAAEWLKVEQNGKEIVLTAGANTVNETKSCTLTVKAGDASASIAVSQKPGSPYPGYTVVNEVSYEYAGTMLYMFGKPSDPDYGGMGFLTLTDEDGNSLALQFYTPLYKSEEEVELPAATYTKGEDVAPAYVGKVFTYIPGTEISFDDDETSILGSTYTATVTETSVAIVDGTFDISVADGTFTIKTDLKDSEGKEYKIKSPLLAEFNVYNLACALLVCLSLGFKFHDLVKNFKDIYVDGRLEMLDTNTPYYVMVDYAHTPNGISNLLKFVHTLDINRSIVVIGSAGERDYLKRPIMGETVLNNASYAVFCYEDPRSEDPRDIIDQLVSTAKETHDNYEIVVDRHDAIQRAVDLAKDKDIVLVLGKGNETYQKLKNETIYFNDVEEAYKAVENRKKREKVTN